jgi:hypothetical protein
MRVVQMRQQKWKDSLLIHAFDKTVLYFSTVNITRVDNYHKITHKNNNITLQ